MLELVIGSRFLVPERRLTKMDWRRVHHQCALQGIVIMCAVASVDLLAGTLHDGVPCSLSESVGAQIQKGLGFIVGLTDGATRDSFLS